jgi:hypothetical protein
MLAISVNNGDGCAIDVGGVTTIANAQPLRLMLDSSWTLKATQIIRPGERFQYRIGVITDEQAFRSGGDGRDQVLRLLHPLPVSAIADL